LTESRELLVENQGTEMEKLCSMILLQNYLHFEETIGEDTEQRIGFSGMHNKKACSLESSCLPPCVKEVDGFTSV
jgi:DNA primase large subunit